MQQQTLFVSLFVVLSLTSAANAQRGSRSGAVLQIDVQTRYPDGAPGPRNVRVLLDSAEGGLYADCLTTEDGKCRFSPRDTGVYIVKIEGGGFTAVSERVELVTNPRGFVTLTLHKTDSYPGVTPASDAPSSEIAASDYNVPEKARQEFAKGQEALQKKEPSKAAEHFQKATRIFDNYPQAYRMLGEAYLQAQDLSKAETALNRSIALDPKLAPAYLDLGAVHNQLKNYGQAETELRKGLELSPDATLGKYELAKAYWALNRWQEAAPLIREVVKQAPELAGAHVVYGNVLLKQRDAVGALAEYKEYLRLDPSGPMASAVREQVAKIEKAIAK